MVKHSGMKTALSFVLIIVCVVGLSILSNRIWGEKSEQIPEPKKWVIENEMTLSQFGQANELPNSVLLEIFKLKAESDLGNKLSAYGTTDQIAGLVTKKLALASEHAAKNWIKIPLKFGLWIILLSVLFIFLRKRKGISAIRRWLLFISLLIFGVVMGSDPSPMGTVKDAIHLYGTKYVIFPPRMIALGIFLLIVFLANKFICAWGCQIGTLQDLIFHINQTDKRKAVFGKQIRLPFALTNTVRFVIFCVFTVIAFSWGFDIIEPVDPFKIYKPAVLGIYGIIFIGILLSSSLFIYRPWCHFFCPFGFVGWLVEKISLVKISVNYETCIACQKCAAACPSTVMGAILRHDKKTIPDCFSCYTCREVCPTDSIRFSSRKRTVPPVDFFEKSQKEKNIA